MKNEPDIVKKLREEEKLGQLNIKSQCSYEQLKIQRKHCMRPLTRQVHSWEMG